MEPLLVLGWYTHACVYVCVNAFAYALFPSSQFQALNLLKDPAQKAWRNQLFTRLKTPQLQAVIAFGMEARTALVNNAAWRECSAVTRAIKYSSAE